MEASSERTVYTDEYRMGNAACDFDDVDPGAKNNNKITMNHSAFPYLLH